MNGRRQQLAWILLLASFSVCISLVVIIPLGINAYIQGATRTLDSTVQANQGTVGVAQGDGETVALFAGEGSHSLNAASSILTNATDTALLLVTAPGSGQLISRIQVYGNTNVSLNKAVTPRFYSSSAAHELALTLSSGRLLLDIPESLDRQFSGIIDVPQGKVIINDPGQYSIITSNTDTQVSVLEGKLKLDQDGQEKTLLDDERGVLFSDGSLEGPLATERNLIANGDFGLGMEQWVKLAANVEIEGQPSVETVIDTDSGDPSLRFKRSGIGHADDGLRQILDHDVTDFESLKLLVNLQVQDQSLGVCGQQGSECPLIVRVDYVDANGVDQTWQQGFYAFGVISPDTPDVCVACPPPLNEHQRIPFKQLAFYESGNLLAELGQQGILPSQLKSVTLIASGHAFDTEVVEIALLAKE